MLFIGGIPLADSVTSTLRAGDYFRVEETSTPCLDCPVAS